MPRTAKSINPGNWLKGIDQHRKKNLERRRDAVDRKREAAEAKPKPVLRVVPKPAPVPRQSLPGRIPNDKHQHARSENDSSFRTIAARPVGNTGVYDFGLPNLRDAPAGAKVVDHASGYAVGLALNGQYLGLFKR